MTINGEGTLGLSPGELQHEEAGDEVEPRREIQPLWPLRERESQQCAVFWETCKESYFTGTNFSLLFKKTNQWTHM